MKLIIGLTILIVGASLVPGFALSRDAEKSAFSDEVIYFLMIDRFDDGDPANNLGDYPDADMLLSRDVEDIRMFRNEHGFDPMDYGYYQGGDFQGILDRLEYISGLGATAIWITPVFRNKVSSFESAGYHGYWILDFTDTDPHFGNAGKFKELVDAAHERGLKVFLDIVANHTADIIHFADNDYSFRPFAHPVAIQAEDLRIKKPLWLNNPAFYHNMGDALLDKQNHPLHGLSSLQGDFFGLDDLATEMPEVLDGMINIYADWIRRFKIDGFRIDTAKHVNMDFWRAFCPAMMQTAEECGIENFRIFGEVSDERGADGPRHGQRFLSEFLHSKAMPSVLDFGFKIAAHDFAVDGGSPRSLANFFRDDSWFITNGASAHDLPTFLSNHDFGRIGFQVVQKYPNAPEQWRDRVMLGSTLMFFARGVRTMYYGDEQGFTGGGDGIDKNARQAMFPNRMQQFLGQKNIASNRRQGADQFNAESELYKAHAELAGIRREHPALRRGVQIPREADEKSGIFAFSRILWQEAREYVAVFNNSMDMIARDITTASPNIRFEQIYPPSEAIATTDRCGQLPVEMPALSAKLYRATQTLPDSAEEPAVTLSPPPEPKNHARKIKEAGFTYVERLPLRAQSNDPLPGSVRFYQLDPGKGKILMGEDRDPPYEIYFDPTALERNDTVVFSAEYENIHGKRCVSAPLSFPAKQTF